MTAPRAVQATALAIGAALAPGAARTCAADGSDLRVIVSTPGACIGPSLTPIVISLQSTGAPIHDMSAVQFDFGLSTPGAVILSAAIALSVGVPTGVFPPSQSPDLLIWFVEGSEGITIPSAPAQLDIVLIPADVDAGILVDAIGAADPDPFIGAQALSNDGITWENGDRDIRHDIVSEPLPLSPIVFVKAGADGLGTGTSWDDAFPSLPQALGFACDGAELWVAAGTYKPTNSTFRSFSFVPGPGQRLYGGFAGWETCRTQRDPVANPTILSGDIGVAGVATDNSYHVVRIDDLTPDESPVLDGFTITGGQADFVVGADSVGGGVHILNASPLIEGCRFTANAARNGGAVHSAAGAGPPPRFRNCEFTLNSAIGSRSSGRGGAILAANGTEIVGCLFDRNTGRRGGAISCTNGATRVCSSTFLSNDAAVDGGAVHVGGADIDIVGCAFAGNDAAGLGGAVALGPGAGSFALDLSTLAGNSAGLAGGIHDGRTEGKGIGLANSILWINPPQSIIWGGGADLPDVDYCLIQGGWPGRGNFSADPKFVDALGRDGDIGTLDDDLRLQATSPCVDAGDDEFIPEDECDVDDDGDTGEALPLDLGGLVRLVGAAVDLGAHEQGAAPPPACPADLNRDGVVDGGDLGALLAEWGTPGGDLTGDCTTDGADLGVLLSNWGKSACSGMGRATLRRR